MNQENLISSDHLQLKIKKNKLNSLKVLTILVLTNLISHFLYFKRFGLYEDDYYNIEVHNSLSYKQLAELILYRLKNFQLFDGHPLSFVPNVYTFFADKLGGQIYFLYIFAFIVVTINAILIFKILKKVFPESELFAIAGALMYILYPPDTAKIFLLTAFVLQGSIMYFLIATLLYLNNWKKISYFVIFICLLSYESPFMLFFGVPLLICSWNKKFLKELTIHSIILCSMIGVIFLFRKLLGEKRISTASSDLFGVIGKIISAMIIGPLFNLYQFLRSPLATINYWINDLSFPFYYSYVFYFIGFCLIMYYWYFYTLKPDYKSIRDEKNKYSESNEISCDDKAEVSLFFNKVLKIFIAGIVLLCLGYSVSFTHYPPTELIGRRTSVHLAATFGASILFACICASVIFISEKYKYKKTAVSILSVYLALLVGYNTTIQKEFVQSWNFQKTFWKQIVKLCPDLKENTVILLSGSSKLFYYTKYILTLSHQSNSLILRQMFRFPNDWVYPPKVLFLFSNWKNNLSQQGDQLILQLPFIQPAIIQDSNVIYVKVNNNLDFSRVDTTFNLNGNIIHTKPKGESTLELYEKTRLYDLIIKSK